MLVDDDRVSLKLLVKELKSPTEDVVSHGYSFPPTDGTDDTDIIHPFHSDSLSCCARSCSTDDTDYDTVASPAILSPTNDTNIHKYEKLICDNSCNLRENPSFLIDIHFNAHTNPQARGAETIVADDATTPELRFATRLAHVTADALDIPLRSIKSESETPHRRLGMLHLTPQSIILEVCFCTSPEDVDAYRKNRERLAEELARNIVELLSY